ncbi:hypothetical protein WR25_24057 [Diploscapter pachys]|uniref:Uncharacterized protein n=1 Tax=Diploscapter pachys TaxID=2018661 RepID=A0A2A2LBD0_9BILA|nr:hypothetical protein WR25_24057 [Diploscapter pachys]
MLAFQVQTSRHYFSSKFVCLTMSIVVAANNSSDISIPTSIQIPTSNITIIDYDPSTFFCLLSSVCLPELLLNLVCIYCILCQSSGLHSSYRLCLLQLQPYFAGVAVSPLAVHFQLSTLALFCAGAGAFINNIAIQRPVTNAVWITELQNGVNTSHGVATAE